MIHDEIREARIAAGLSQVEVARRTGVARSQIVALENGGNVTLKTLRRVLAVFPNLTRVTLGGVEVCTANADVQAVRSAALHLLDVAKRLEQAISPANET